MFGGGVGVVALMKSVLCQRTWTLAACRTPFVPVTIVLSECVAVMVSPFTVVTVVSKNGTVALRLETEVGEMTLPEDVTDGLKSEEHGYCRKNWVWSLYVKPL